MPPGLDALELNEPILESLCPRPQVGAFRVHKDPCSQTPRTIRVAPRNPYAS